MSTATVGSSAPLRIGVAALAAVVALIVGLPVLAIVSMGLVGGGRGADAGSLTDAAALDRWMRNQVSDSPLVGLGAVFVSEGVRNGIDPRVLVAIARHESVLGTEGSGAEIHNAFGWGPAIPFLSWRDNIATVAAGLATRYVAQNHDTLAAIQPIWAPVGAANDPGDLNSAWLEAVGDSYADLGGDPQRPITLAAQARIAATLGAAGLATPTGGRGSIGGGPGEGTHSYSAWPNNWQSDHAVDIALPFGSPVYATDAGTIARVGGDPSDFSGRFGGAQLTVVSSDDEYYYAHLSGVSVREGDRVGLGQLIGFSGQANGVDHLHLGVMRRDPIAVSGLR